MYRIMIINPKDEDTIYYADGAEYAGALYEAARELVRIGGGAVYMYDNNDNIIDAEE